MSYFTDMFKSKEEKEEHSNNYVKMIFPLGLEQRDQVSGIVNEIFPNHPEGVVLFNYISAKQYFIENKKGEGLDRAIKQLKKIRPKVKSNQLAMIYALMQSDLSIEDISMYPRLEELKSLSEQYMELFD